MSSVLLALGLCALPAASAQVGASRVAPEERITLGLVGTDIRDALRLVAKQGGVNLVMSNAVQGAVTLELRDVSMTEALDAIVGVGGFQYTIGGSIVTVSTFAELLEHAGQRKEYMASKREVLILELRYVEAARIQPVVENLIGEGGSVSLLKTADHVAQEYGGGTSAPSDEEGALQIGSHLSTTSSGLPAKSHTLIVVDVPERLERIRSVVERLDVKPVQVLIEARFVEVTLDETDKLGVDWNVVARGTGAGAPHTFPIGDSSLGSFNPEVAGGSPNELFPGAPNSVTTPAAAGLFTFGTLDFTAFSAVLEAIRTDLRMQVVSSPRVVVGDRHTATILVGERYPILSANVSEFGSVTEQLDRYEPIGVQLEVTPSVLNDDEVELFVRPSTSSLGPLVTGSTGISVTRINSRQIDTAVTVKDRQTVVLGGLITTRETETTSRVPFLGSVPILGRLFKHRSTAEERIDLVVFLTVAILQDHALTAEQRAMFERTTPDGGLALPPTGARSPLEYSRPDPQY